MAGELVSFKGLSSEEALEILDEAEKVWLERLEKLENLKTGIQGNLVELEKTRSLIREAG
jgi:hypothetical protein